MAERRAHAALDEVRQARKGRSKVASSDGETVITFSDGIAAQSALNFSSDIDWSCAGKPPQSAITGPSQ